MGQRTSGMENSRCKGPEVGTHLCVKGENSSETAAQRARGTVTETKSEGQGVSEQAWMSREGMWILFQGQQKARGSV